ncbi:hypothetical protein ACFQZE_10295 [Paenibacillus sp. GCM10027627]|uniref:hypothetical protein n=1 Tax=unclassified Paenibacillus TaxID=185978 RepID=UPI00363EB594
MKINKPTLERIEKIPWFVNCGKPLDIQINLPVKYVGSWVEAKKKYNLLIWENTSLEARNELTDYLQEKAYKQFDCWNDLMKEIRPFIEIHVEPHLQEPKERFNLDKGFIDNVKWDIANAIMEDTYSRFYKKKFFLDLLSIYEAGSFPCGWEGKWPKGTLLVY